MVSCSVPGQCEGKTSRKSSLASLICTPLSDCPALCSALYFHYHQSVVLHNTKPTETWFYRVDIPSDRKHFSKTKPMELKHFEDCITWWNNREIIPDGEYFKAQKYTADYLLNEQGCNIDLCGYPHEEEEFSILSIRSEYQERRTSSMPKSTRCLQSLKHCCRECNQMIPEQLKLSICNQHSKVSSRENVCQTKLRMIYTSRYNLKSKD